MSIITVTDNTTFTVNFLDIYREIVKTFLINKILEFPNSGHNTEKQNQFDVLFITPTNLASNFYKTDFFITSLIVDGVQVKGKQDLDGLQYTDITSVDEQIYFNFED